MGREELTALVGVLRTAARYEREHIGITFDHGNIIIDAVTKHGDLLADALERQAVTP